MRKVTQKQIREMRQELLDNGVDLGSSEIQDKISYRIESALDRVPKPKDLNPLPPYAEKLISNMLAVGRVLNLFIVMLIQSVASIVMLFLLSLADIWRLYEAYRMSWPNTISAAFAVGTVSMYVFLAYRVAQLEYIANESGSTESKTKHRASVIFYRSFMAGIAIIMVAEIVLKLYNALSESHAVVPVAIEGTIALVMTMLFIVGVKVVIIQNYADFMATDGKAVSMSADFLAESWHVYDKQLNAAALEAEYMVLTQLLNQTDIPENPPIFIDTTRQPEPMHNGNGHKH